MLRSKSAHVHIVSRALACSTHSVLSGAHACGAYSQGCARENEKAWLVVPECEFGDKVKVGQPSLLLSSDTTGVYCMLRIWRNRQYTYVMEYILHGGSMTLWATVNTF